MSIAADTSAGRPIPDARGHWLLGMARALAKAPHTFPAQLGWDNGNVVRFRLMHRPFVAVTDAVTAREVLHSDQFRRSYHYKAYAALLGQSLFATDGPHWARRRRMVLPAFRTAHLDRFARVMRDCSVKMLDRWETARREGKPIDAVDEGHRITLAVMGQSLMSVPIDTDEADRFAHAIEQTLLAVRLRNTSLLRLPLWLPSPVHSKIKNARAALDSHIVPHVAQRMALNTNDGRDLLDDLRAARAAGSGEPMTFTELVEETKTLFVTGYETTAVSLAWALYNLATSPEAAARWHEEADRVLAGNTPPDVLRLEDFPYTAAIVNETMRLYPAVYNVGRVCLADTDIAGYRFRKGDIALISIFGIHRHPHIWNDPETFRPERFLNKANLNRDAFIPFASGGHMCLGAHFAVMEMITVLAMIGQRYRLRTLNTTPPGMVGRITLAPDRALPIALEARQ